MRSDCPGDVRLREDLGFAAVSVRVLPVGGDLLIEVEGGVAHVGCAVVAQPRASLTGDGSTSATSSVINVVGHKDELVLRPLAERVCVACECTVACVGGVHVDAIDPAQIERVAEAFDRLADRIVRTLREEGRSAA